MRICYINPAGGALFQHHYAERQHWGDLLAAWPSIASGYDLPAADRALWARLTDPAERERLLDDPDFSCSEGHVLAVGIVP